jgi:hypothetical protein
VGRIEEVRAEKDGADLVVTEYLMGPGALRERLAARLGRGAKGYAASWNQLDLSDPDRPCLNCSAEELRKLGASRRRHRRQR